jgi:mediator of RNA polymerase II transcription subunit 14
VSWLNLTRFAVCADVSDRNPDLLTAISVLSAGTYTRFPTAITDTFKHVPRLTNRTILRTLRRLNRHILYRLRCADYLPAELFIESVRDGKVYFGAGGEHGWKAHMTVVGFGEGDDARWWLTGVEWGWKAAQRGTDDPGGARKLSGDERQQILDVVNHEILPPRPVPDTDDMDSDTEKVDSPLVRLFNFLREYGLDRRCQG